MEKIFYEIKDKINNANKIALFTHVSCDCDGIGCMLALYNFLTEKGKNVDLFCDSDVPEKYGFLKGIENLNKLENSINNSSLKKELELENHVDFSKYDLLISLDTSTLGRLGKYETDFKNFEETINIDHHISNTNYAKINYVKPYSSCGEALFELFIELGLEISQDVATCLFAAISSDTNRFSNSNISAKTHIFAGKLIELGADHNLVNLWLHKNKTKNQLKLISYMAKNLKYYKGISYFYMSLNLLKKLNVKSSDVSSFMHIICNSGDSKINIVIKERKKGEYRLSLRSVSEYDVNKVCSVFGGGGHKNAGGCSLYGNFKKEFKKLIKECLKEIEAVDLKLK